jgi:cytosine deaminase
VDAPDKWEAIRRLATTTLVVKDGEVISETSPSESRLMGEIVDFERKATRSSGEEEGE